MKLLYVLALTTLAVASVNADPAAAPTALAKGSSDVAFGTGAGKATGLFQQASLELSAAAWVYAPAIPDTIKLMSGDVYATRAADEAGRSMVGGVAAAYGWDLTLMVGDVTSGDAKAIFELENFAGELTLPSANDQVDCRATSVGAYSAIKDIAYDHMCIFEVTSSGKSVTTIASGVANEWLYFAGNVDVANCGTLGAAAGTTAIAAAQRAGTTDADSGTPTAQDAATQLGCTTDALTVGTGATLIGAGSFKATDAGSAVKITGSKLYLTIAEGTDSDSKDIVLAGFAKVTPFGADGTAKDANAGGAKFKTKDMKLAWFVGDAQSTTGALVEGGNGFMKIATAQSAKVKWASALVYKASGEYSIASDEDAKSFLAINDMAVVSGRLL